jgi:hypothetical protein
VFSPTKENLPEYGRRFFPFLCLANTYEICASTV